MRVLVTGANGYLGRALLAELDRVGVDPVALVRQPDGAGPGVETRRADLTEPASLGPVLRGVDAVCHLGGLVRARESLADPLGYFAVNTAGTVHLLAAMTDAGVSGLVFASTAAVYGTPPVQPMTEELPDAPPHPYAASKLAAEQAIGWHARTGALGATVLRLFNLAGGDDPDPTRIIPRTLAAAIGRGPALEIYGDGRATRDFVHVADVASAVVAAVLALPPAGETRRYNIGSGVGSSVADVVAAVETVTGRDVPVVHRPPAPEPPVLVSDSSLARAELGWRPTRSALREIVADLWSRQSR